MGNAIALGNFDGVHIAHQALLQRTNTYAKAHGLTSMAFTFDKNPASVLSGQEVPAIFPLEERKKLLTRAVETLHVEPCTKAFLSISAEAFIERLFKQHQMEYIAVGFNNTFGAQGRGNSALLQEYGKRYGFYVDVIAEQKLGGVTVSSTNIKKALAEGRMSDANALLGRRYSIRGIVVQGRQLGRTWGIPTVNIRLEEGRVWPKNGVYKAQVVCAAGSFLSMVNIGYAPTVGKTEHRLEAHLFDFDGDLYGQEIEVFFEEFIREERRFADTDALQAQIKKDIQQIKFVY